MPDVPRMMQMVRRMHDAFEEREGAARVGAREVAWPRRARLVRRHPREHRHVGARRRRSEVVRQEIDDAMALLAKRARVEGAEKIVHARIIARESELRDEQEAGLRLEDAPLAARESERGAHLEIARHL